MKKLRSLILLAGGIALILFCSSCGNSPKVDNNAMVIKGWNADDKNVEIIFTTDKTTNNMPLTQLQTNDRYSIKVSGKEDSRGTVIVNSRINITFVPSKGSNFTGVLSNGKLTFTGGSRPDAVKGFIQSTSPVNPPVVTDGLEITFNTSEENFKAGANIVITLTAKKGGLTDTGYDGEKFVIVSDFSAAPIAASSFGSLHGVPLTTPTGSLVNVNFKEGVAANIILKLNSAEEQFLTLVAQDLESADLYVNVLPGSVALLEIFTPAAMSMAYDIEYPMEEFSTLPVIMVYDEFKNPCPSMTVTATITVSGVTAVLSNASAVSDIYGEADFDSLTIWSNGPFSGATLTYSVGNVSVAQSNFSWK